MRSKADRISFYHILYYFIIFYLLSHYRCIHIHIFLCLYIIMHCTVQCENCEKNNWGGWQIRGEALQAPKEVEFGEGWCCGGGQPPREKNF